MPIKAHLYDAGGIDRDVEIDERLVAELTPERLLWVDIDGDSKREGERVARLLGLGTGMVTNGSDASARPHLHNYGEYFHVSVAAVKSETDTRYEPVALDLFSGPNYVVTIHTQEVGYLNEFRAREKGDTQLGELTSPVFVAALLDWHLSTYFRVIERLEGEVDRLDEEVLKRSSARDVLPRLSALRRRVSRLRRLLSPHRDVFYALSRPDFRAVADTPAASHFRALNDRFERAEDAVENARDLVIGSFELFSTQTTQRTNDVVKVLTFVTVLIGALGVIAGALGMNFQMEFYKSGPVGFWEVIAGMSVLALGAIVVGKWKGWL
jgi:magnesium transporter